MDAAPMPRDKKQQQDIVPFGKVLSGNWYREEASRKTVGESSVAAHGKKRERRWDRRCGREWTRARRRESDEWSGLEVGKIWDVTKVGQTRCQENKTKEKKTHSNHNNEEKEKEKKRGTKEKEKQREKGMKKNLPIVFKDPSVERKVSGLTVECALIKGVELNVDDEPIPADAPDEDDDVEDEAPDEKEEFDDCFRYSARDGVAEVRANRGAAAGEAAANALGAALNARAELRNILLRFVWRGNLTLASRSYTNRLSQVPSRQRTWHAFLMHRECPR
ncbi:hypothetical protein BJ741DRAFT_580241 [Chytriomyces cf. hyalinus JEL632]|nr:hypothetical protein BJ741DRAFT_580241 [Chytriomyces cf. hyalinus JEL632]